MYTIEFEAKVNDGTIKVPDKYKNRLGNNVKVIILAKEDNEKITTKGFSTVKLKTKDFIFDREAANER